MKGSAANVTFGKTHTAAAEFETSDSPKDVAEFYRSKYPGAMFVSSETNHFSLVAGGKENITTINIEAGRRKDPDIPSPASREKRE